MVNAVRAVGGRDVNDAGQRHHFPAVITGLQQADILGARTIGRISLHHHAVGSPEQIEVVYIQRAQVNLERLVDIVQLQALFLGARTVHLDPELRDIDAVRTEATGKPWSLRGFRDGCLGGGKQGVVAEAGTVFDLNGNAAEQAQAAHRRELHDADPGFLDGREQFLQTRHHGLCRQFFAGAFRIRLQAHEHHGR